MDDPYSRVDYRRLIAWPRRIRREWPLLAEVLGSGPSRRVLDLGSGTGEHSRFLVEQGFEVVGIDASESMHRRATEEEPLAELLFIHGSITELDRVVEGVFGGAICLGNTLPHLRTDDQLADFANGLRSRLGPGGRLVLQIVNYERVFGNGQRYLPLSFRPGGDEEIVFLRLLSPQDDGTVLFYPSTLRLRAGADPPLELIQSKEVRIRGWLRGELEAALEAAGFGEITAYGAFDRSPYEPLESPDLILVAG